MATIVDFFKNIIGWVVGLFSACWEWFLDLCWSFYEALFDGLCAVIPSMQEYVHYLDVIKPYLKLVNTFVAFDLGISLFTTYLSFVAVFITVKLIIKLIPSIG